MFRKFGMPTPYDDTGLGDSRESRSGCPNIPIVVLEIDFSQCEGDDTGLRSESEEEVRENG